ncbi:MAG: hypothetical protein AAGD96_17615, partial [Chloroflexota bacterium]
HAKMQEEREPMLKVAYATSLGKLGGTQAINDIFVLYRDLHIQVQRGEVGLALARLSGDEKYYTTHWRSIRFDPATTMAQSVLALQKLTNDSVFEELSAASAAAFAEHHVEDGVDQLILMIENFPAGIVDPILIEMQQECATLLKEFGGKRLEYILLTLHVLDRSLNPA